MVSPAGIWTHGTFVLTLIFRVSVYIIQRVRQLTCTPALNELNLLNITVVRDALRVSKPALFLHCI